MDTFAIAQFTTQSSKGIVNVMFGFIPDAVILFSNLGGTSPDVYIWTNVSKASLWATALSLLVTGTTGVITKDATGITAYAGGDAVTTAETVNTAGKHVNRAGTASGVVASTAAGIAIPADHQTDAGNNVVWAFRADG